MGKGEILLLFATCEPIRNESVPPVILCWQLTAYSVPSAGSVLRLPPDIVKELSLPQ